MQEMRDAGLIPGLGRSPEVENGNPLQYSCLENSTNRGAWLAKVLEVAMSWTDWATEHSKPSSAGQGDMGTVNCSGYHGLDTVPLPLASPGDQSLRGSVTCPGPQSQSLFLGLCSPIL